MDRNKSCSITITQPKAQQHRTGKSVAETIAAIKTPLTSDEALAYTGLGNSFDKEAVEKEIDLQREVSQDFGRNTQQAAGEIKQRIAANDAQFEAGLISEQERDARNSSLRNYAWILETVSAGLATPSNSLAGSLVAAASPTIAKEIGQQFKQTGQEGSAGHYLAHAGLGAVVAAATGNSIAGNALAAAGAEAAAPIAASWIYGKDVSQLTPDEKATVSSIAGLAGAGLSGAAGGDGRSLVSGSVAGRTAAENNYLSSAQQAQMDKEYSECHDRLCKASTVAQWTAISLGQDGAFASGMVAGVPAAMYDAVEGLVKMGLSPIETFDAIKSLVMSGDLVGNVADSMKQSFIERIDRLTTEYERAGASGSFKAGVEAGKLIVDVMPWVTGGLGLAKTGVVLTEKIVAKAVAKKGAVVTNATKAADLPEPAPARSFIRLTEEQRLDKKLELFDNFTGGASRIKNAQITIDGQVYKANPAFSKNAAVFDNVPQGKVMEYFKDLAGVEFLPKPLPMPKMVDVHGNIGLRYTVEKDGLTYNLRSGSKSVDQTRAKWTIEVTGVDRYRVGDRILKRDYIEVKFR